MVSLRWAHGWALGRCYIVATCDRDLKRRIRKVDLYYTDAWILLVFSNFHCKNDMFSWMKWSR